jgi:hypothetical protein
MSQLRFLLRVGVLVAVIVAAKLLAHQLGWEKLTLNALFTGIIAANVFLMGFLLSGVLSDYKESERLPGELSACLENMAQEVAAMGVGKPEAQISPCLGRLAQLSEDILGWFHKKLDTEAVMASLNDLTVQFARLEPWTQATFVARLKQEQSNLRRTMTRIETIRETSFVSSGYLLAELITLMLCLGLVMINMPGQFEESLFFTGIISFLLTFLLLLIKDLDNPFGYYERFSGADVSLEPLQAGARRIRAMAGAASRPAPKAAAPSATVRK